LLASRINPCNHRIRALPGNCWCKARRHSCIITYTSHISQRDGNMLLPNATQSIYSRSFLINVTILLLLVTWTDAVLFVMSLSNLPLQNTEFHAALTWAFNWNTYNKKLSYCRKTVWCVTLVNLCYISQGIGNRKVSNSKSDLKGHSRGLVMVAFDISHMIS